MSSFLSLLLAVLVFAPGKAVCDRGPASRALDFWVGSWTVRNAEGKEVGRSVVVHLAGGCAVHEQFSGADGEGASLATYNSNRERWDRLFTNTAGMVVHQEGRSVDGGLVFVGTADRADGIRLHMRTTLRPDGPGRVRQHVELSDDGGASWRVLGSAVYVRL